MILPDANVLICAYRPDSDGHPSYKHWLEALINGPAPYAISPQVLGAVVRICTNSRIFAQPSPLDLVLKFTTALMKSAQCHIVQPGPEHWNIFTQLCRDVQASGNLVQEAWFAALAIESGCEFITTDRDFARFPHLRARTPF